MVLVVTNLPANAGDTEMPVRSLDREDPLRRSWQPMPVCLPGESHGQRRLEGYGPWDHKGLDTTEVIKYAAA